MRDDKLAGLKTCIIGAGCSGFTTAKRLKDFGLAYDHFEMSDNIGGNWYHKIRMANRPVIKACILTPPNTGWHLKIFRCRKAGRIFPITACCFNISMIMLTILACAKTSASKRR